MEAKWHKDGVKVLWYVSYPSSLLLFWRVPFLHVLIFLQKLFYDLLTLSLSCWLVILFAAHLDSYTSDWRQQKSMVWVPFLLCAAKGNEYVYEFVFIHVYLNNLWLLWSFVRSYVVFSYWSSNLRLCKAPSHGKIMGVSMMCVVLGVLRKICFCYEYSEMHCIHFLYILACLCKTGVWNCGYIYIVFTFMYACRDGPLKSI